MYASVFTPIYTSHITALETNECLVLAVIAGCKVTSGGEASGSHAEPQGEVRPHSLDQRSALDTDFPSGTKVMLTVNSVFVSSYT